MPLLRQLQIMLLLGAMALPASAESAPPSITRGFADSAFTNLADGQRERALMNARLAGAEFIRLDVAWGHVAPPGRRKPRGFRASDPSDHRYRWAILDRAVRETVSVGLEPLIIVLSAPDWAEGPDRPRRRSQFTRSGVWKPQPQELAAFLTAAARRYSGEFSELAVPGTRLPRVRNWQVWNEPNLWSFLQPQWQRHGRWVESSAAHYRRMLNASYAALKRVDPSNRVIAGGLAPFGDLKPTPVGGRVAPTRFLRALLCLRGRRTLRRACRAPTRFDSYAFHPYSPGGPFRRALNADDTAIPDAYKLRRVVRAGLRIGTVRPPGEKGLWATEMGWDSRPPNPRGLRPGLQARYLNDSLYVLWRSGVSRAINLLVRDLGGPHPRLPLDPGRRRSGVFYRRRSVSLDIRKPSFLAMRFPFVVRRASEGRSRAWGVPPCPQAACIVTIERRSVGRWIVLATVGARRQRVFQRTITVGRRAVLRARIAGTRTWSLTTRPRRFR